MAHNSRHSHTAGCSAFQCEQLTLRQQSAGEVQWTGWFSMADISHSSVRQCNDTADWMTSSGLYKTSLVITFRVRRQRRSRGEMYICHGRLCVCLCVCPSPYSHTTAHGPVFKFGECSGEGVPLVVHYWADLQSVHGFRCYDNTAPNAKCQRVLVLALCLVRHCSVICLWFHVPLDTKYVISKPFIPANFLA